MKCPCPVCGGLGEVHREPGKAWLLDRIKDGREQGLTVTQIAGMVGKSSSTVEKYLNRMGIRKRTVTNDVAENRESR